MALPTVNCGADVTIAQASLPHTQDFTAVGTPGTGGSSITAYQWYLEGPAGHGATLVNATSATVTLNGADTWGNYRLFCVVTDDTAATSEANPYEAPNDAFVQLRVTSTNLSLQKRANGARDAILREHEVTAAVEQLANDVDALALQDLTDVTAPTSVGASLDNLMDDSYATDDGTNSGTSLHKHTGAQVDKATVTTDGVLKVAEAPVDPANPQAVTQDRTGWSGTVWGTLVSGTLTLGILDTPTTSSNESTANWAIKAHDDRTILELAVTLADAGTVAGGGYEVTFYVMTEAQFLANNFGAATVVATIAKADLTPGSDHAPASHTVGGLSVAIGAREFIAARITDGPSGAARGNGWMALRVEAVKRW